MNDEYLFDSSVWINLWKGNQTRSVQLLKDLINREKKVWVCPVIIQECLQGARSMQNLELLELYFQGLYQLDCQHYLAHSESAKIYLKLRKKGLTIRKPNDCLIAWYAIQNDLTLAHDDVDFERIKELYPLKTFH